ncbi:MAG: hypothetical protein ABIJ96_00630 [Elusimicrobiota bacterium]
MTEPPPTPKPRKKSGCLKVLAIGAALFVLFIYQWVNNPAGVMHGESDVKMNLGSIRSAISIYYGDMEGLYPADLGALTVGGRYIERIPRVWDNDGGRSGDSLFPASKPAVPHPLSAEAEYFDGFVPRDSGRWGYVNNPASKEFGVVFVDCTHTDSKGTSWHTY